MYLYRGAVIAMKALLIFKIIFLILKYISYQQNIFNRFYEIRTFLFH